MQTNAKYALISGICLSTVLCTLKAPLKYNCKAKGDLKQKKSFFSAPGVPSLEMCLNGSILVFSGSLLSCERVG